MSSLMARLLLLVYVLLATLLHPCLCMTTASATASNWRMDAKAIDQGIAYVLMLGALFITYIVH